MIVEFPRKIPKRKFPLAFDVAPQKAIHKLLSQVSVYELNIAKFSWRDTVSRFLTPLITVSLVFTLGDH
jgi:hypothetical protein